MHLFGGSCKLEVEKLMGTEYGLYKVGKSVTAVFSRSIVDVNRLERTDHNRKLLHEHENIIVRTCDRPEIQ